MDLDPRPGWPRQGRARTVLIHVCVWTGFVLLLVAAEGGREDRFGSWVERLLYPLGLLALALPPVYVHFGLLRRFYRRGRRAAYLAWLAATLVGWTTIYAGLSAALSYRFVGLVASFFLILLAILLSSAFWLYGELGRQRAELEEARAKHLQAELDLLKGQIHPHFLFNTLNNLFGLARKGDGSAADGIAGLSHLLRYMIYESGAGRVGLDREAEQIRRLVELEKLRFASTDDIEVALSIGPGLSAARVPPMLLIPLVENAFKHGVRRSARSFVRIALAADEGVVRFAVENSTHPPRASLGVPAPGIGLHNVRRRLELLYPDTHELTISDSGGVFRVELRLDDQLRRAGR